MELEREQCLVCQYSLAAPIFNGGDQPLATLGWARSAEEAQSMKRHALNYVQCPRCTHVWNRSFTYEAIPYVNSPNRMYNKGAIWQGHLKTTRDIAVSVLPHHPTVIDVGCGEGHFVRGIAESLYGKGRFLGFDPNATNESGVGVEFHPRYFEPLQDIEKYQPDLLIMRHVLEHLTDPAVFMDQLAWGASRLQKPVYFFAEMPCIDRVLTTDRLVDFFYEHPSQFTSRSFRTLMNRGGEIASIDTGYDGEVVYGLVKLQVPEDFHRAVKAASSFHEQSSVSRKSVQEQLDSFIHSGKRIAIWGGTGKAAAFIHFYDANSVDFPLVVDSDQDKVGTFVPKTGQRIEFRDVLKMQKIDIVIIPPQWRAKDIVAEMERENIRVDQVLIEHQGRLINFHKDTHPYK